MLNLANTKRIFFILAVFILVQPCSIFASTHTMRTSFDITVDAANEILATKYYSESPVLSRGSRNVAGDFTVNLIMYQPTADNINIFKGNLYVELTLKVVGEYSIGDQTTPINRGVPIRIGLKEQNGLRFAAAQIQFLDQNLPVPLQGIIRRYIDSRLIQLKDFLVTAANIVNALATTTLTVKNSTLAYSLWYGRPELRIEKRNQNVLLIRLPVHANLQAAFPDFGTLEEQYHKIVDAIATINFNANSKKIELTVEIAADSCPITELPDWLELVCRSVLRKKFDIYEGQPYEAVNERIPAEIAIAVVAIYDEEPQILDDRVRIVAKIESESQEPQFKIYVKRRPESVDIKIESNIKVTVSAIGVQAVTAPLIDLRDPGIIQKNGSYETVWSGRAAYFDVLGRPVNPDITHLIYVLLSTEYNFFWAIQQFSGVGPDSDWLPLK